MHTLQSQHPVERGTLAYAVHIHLPPPPLELLELESEQRLLLLRTDRHIKSTGEEYEHRVSLAGTPESLVYVACVLLQICSIKRHILHHISISIMMRVT
ncbi:hypothetical protein SPRG_10876 [Saprolegnia parasitica CBS 223.65]|uniref:Uncharacterized protein n=1 Tax=Saprolegnia parasitica (strain CBS 223.65) TaxID=695850 RepID=A0A067BZY4_SAPPC|nr:hypothetical protein SPRG_10876 [Saprolegnia parasitica CBS 223.65]KDO24089.1 hypothetical protein SPRG_10876 [Saprolegnia parasitica CBS 223.65]|eukprot:XP_012205225.1 hypothetical protein SPRG_10876 [Saprolegnia parasitica CBS 223.65]